MFGSIKPEINGKGSYALSNIICELFHLLCSSLLKRRNEQIRVIPFCRVMGCGEAREG